MNKYTYPLRKDKQLFWSLINNSGENTLSTLSLCAKKDNNSFCTQTLKHIYCGKTNHLLTEEKLKTQKNTKKEKTTQGEAMPEKSMAWHTHLWYRHIERKRQKNLGSPTTLVLVWHFQALLLPSGSAPPRQWGSGWSFLSFIFYHKDKDSRWSMDDFIKYRRKA